MKRLYFLCPDLAQASAVVACFQGAGIDDDYLHVVGKDHHALQAAHLHAASDLDTTRLREGLDTGLVAGGSLGLLAGLAAVVVNPFGIAVGGGTVLALSLAGMGFGGWFGSMVGSRRPDIEVHDFEEAINAGQLLVMADVPAERLPEFYRIIKSFQPNAEVHCVHLDHDHELAA